MGKAFNFMCPGCGYQATASGGDDAGMMGATTTVSCAGCKELYDILIWSVEEPERELAPRCPEDPAHPVSRWSAHGPCPRCGRKMVQGDLQVLWD